VRRGPERDPAVFWRVEKAREERARRILAGEEEGDAEGLGTMTLLAGGVMHQLNLLGGEVWKLCDGSRGRGEIVAQVAARFDAPADEVRTAVTSFLDDLVARGLLREGMPEEVE
jgi:pyrroloquinoline quinone biosynthesis protein D